jgi:hypothetical protein
MDPLVGPAEEHGLFSLAATWAATRGAEFLASSTDDEVEAALLHRTGFARHGLAADGRRSLYRRPCSAGPREPLRKPPPR